MLRRGLVAIFAAGATCLSPAALAQNGPFADEDLAAESLAINEQYFARVMRSTHALFSENGFIYFNMLLSPPSDDDGFWVGVDLAMSVPFAEFDVPFLGPSFLAFNTTGQIYAIPRVDPRVAAARAGRNYAVSGLVTEEEQAGLNWALGFDLVNVESGSFVQVGVNLGAEFDAVSSNVSPYLFTNLALLDGLRALFDLGISPGGSKTVSRIAGGLEYRFTDLLPGFDPVTHGSDVEVGVNVLRTRQILADQTNTSGYIAYYPKVNSAVDMNEDGAKRMLVEDRLEVRVGYIGLDYDGDLEPTEPYDEEGLFVRVAARYAFLTAGVSAVPGTGVGWQAGLDVGIIGLTIQHDYLLDSLYNTALTGYTVFAYMKWVDVFE